MSILLNYAFGLIVQRHRHRAWLVVCIVLNILALIHYKYIGFLLNAIGLPENSAALDYAKNIILPIGISFYTFQGVSYVIDVWRGDVNAEKNPVIFGAYLSFFPQLIAGPIVRYRDVEKDFSNPDVSLDNMFAGFARFAAGLFKKIVIADTMGSVADSAFGLQDQPIGMAAAWAGAIAYSLQIYFDFSGYSDMALGIARIFGIKIPENFNHPYAASTITNFWRRWHISLSTWFRDYLYIPLGGNRGGSARTYFNLFIVFLTTGIWHGAAWTFLFWGLWHGLFIILERVFLGKTAATLENPLLRFLYCLPVVIFGWVLFRAPDMQSAFSFMFSMVNFGQSNLFDLSGQIFAVHSNFEIAVLLIGTLLIGLQGSYKPLGVWMMHAHKDEKTGVETFPSALGLLVRFIIATLMIGFSTAIAFSADFSPFLYFRF